MKFVTEDTGYPFEFVLGKFTLELNFDVYLEKVFEHLKPLNWACQHLIMSGFDLNEFIGLVNECMICPLCLDVINDAKQCSNGHCFCSNCLMQALEKRQVCPICKVSTLFVNCQRSLIGNNVIAELQMRCPSVKLQTSARIGLGDLCSWTGIAEQRARHYKGECGHRVIQCLSCNENMLAKQMISHSENQCAYRTESCKYCYERMPHMLMSNHLSMDCEMFPVECLKGCGGFSCRRNMKLHLSEECPLGQVKCKIFESNGCHECDGVVLRKDFSNHISSVVRLTAIVERLSNMYNVDGSTDNVPKQSETIEEPHPISLNKNQRRKANKNRLPGSDVQYLQLDGKWVDAQVLEYKEKTDSKAILRVNGVTVSASLVNIRLVAGSLMVVHSDDLEDGRKQWWVLNTSGDKPFFGREGQIVYKMQSVSPDSRKFKIDVDCGDMTFVTPYLPTEISVFHPTYEEALMKLKRIV
jgi:hypothetical protein